MNGNTDGPRLSEELAAIDATYPGWHCWLSDGGRVCATHCNSRAEMHAIEDALPARDEGLLAPCGVTLDAGTPQRMRYVIAEYLHQAAIGRAA